MEPSHFCGSIISMNNKRTVNRIWVLTLYGQRAEEFQTIDEALDYVSAQPEKGSGGLIRIELQVRFVDGIHIDGQFRTNSDAKEFLSNRKKGLL